MTQLGRYEILQQLASGGVADVLLARASGLEGFSRHVVIERIRPDLSSDGRFAKAFLDEARIAASLHHQNIVQVYDIDEQGGSYFFTMEYVHGEDARKMLLKVRESNTQIPLDQVIAIGAAAAAGLHHAHEQIGPDRKPLGLVHRDVSPGNILIGYDGSVKLVDFGLARAALRSAKTRTGSLRGKAPYMSPELCCGHPIDRRSDTFALGIVLYELATARRLFKSDNDFLTMAAIVEGEIQPPSVHRPDLPRQFDEIIMRALSKAPESRYQTADDLRNALETFAIERELRTGGKALSDYMAKLFGPKVEPWHEAAQPVVDASVDFDDARLGLVAAPTGGAAMMAKLAPKETSPIALAQNLAEDRPDPGFEVDEEPTRANVEIDDVPTQAAPARSRGDHTTIPQPMVPDAPIVRASPTSFPRPTTSGDGPTRIDLPAAPSEATEATSELPSAPPSESTDASEPIDPDDEPATIRISAEAAAAATAPKPVAARPAPLRPIRIPQSDDDLVTQRQQMTPIPPEPDEETSVSPPIFPVQPHPVLPPRIQTEPAYRAPLPPTVPTYRRWIVIGAAILAPLIIVSIAIKACGHKDSSKAGGTAALPDAVMMAPPAADATETKATPPPTPADAAPPPDAAAPDAAPRPDAGAPPPPRPPRRPIRPRRGG